MKFIKSFNDIVLFVILAFVAWTVGSSLIAEAQCPQSREYYESACQASESLGRMGIEPKPQDRQNCACAYR